MHRGVQSRGARPIKNADPVPRSPSPTMTYTMKDSDERTSSKDPYSSSAAQVSTTDQYIEALKHRVQMLQTQNDVLSSQKPDWTPAHTERLVKALHAEEKKVSELELQLSTEKQLVLHKDQELEVLKKTTAAELATLASSRTELERKQEETSTSLEESHKQYQDYAKLRTEFGNLQIQHTALTKESSKVQRELQQLEETLQIQQTRYFEIEQDLTRQLAEKDHVLSEVQNELEAKSECFEVVSKQLHRLETWKKSLAISVPESVLAKQLLAIRKEHESGLVAMQMKQADLRASRDRIARLEQECSSLNNNVRRLSVDLQGKTEHMQALQERLRVVEGDAQLKKQLQDEVEILRGEATMAAKERARLEAENSDFFSRLDLSLKDIPAEFEEAFLAPVTREKEEYQRAAERHLHSVKRLEKESVAIKVEVADLHGRLTAACEAETELQRKVVGLTLQMERLQPLDAELAAANVEIQSLTASAALTQQRLEKANQDAARSKEELKRECEMKENLEKVIQEVATLQLLGDSVQKLQTSLNKVGSAVTN